MQTQPAPPDDLLVQRSRAVRARRGPLDLERAALLARGAVLRARTDRAHLHARLVRSAAGHALQQSTEAVHPSRRPLDSPAHDGYRPVVAFTGLVAEFLHELARSHPAPAGSVAAGAGAAKPHTERLLALIARGRELQRRPAHLMLLPQTQEREREA
jgi:hypothetical protein